MYYDQKRLFHNVFLIYQTYFDNFNRLRLNKYKKMFISLSEFKSSQTSFDEDFLN